MDAEGDIIDRDPFEKMSPPKIGEAVVPVVELEHLRKLLATCKGTDFESRRDYTMFSMLLDTGARLSELAGMKVNDIDMRFEVVVVKGKGDRNRALPLSPKMLEQLGRYLRARGRHKAASSEWLWLGKRGRLYHRESLRRSSGVLMRRGFLTSRRISSATRSLIGFSLLVATKGT